MGFRRVSAADMAGKGNLGQADTPGVSASEMQRIMDELPREVLAPALNELAGQLEAAEAAALLGAQPPGEAVLPQDTPCTVQGVLDALLNLGLAHEAKTDNPHGVTAAQAGAYTKAETDAAINQKVVEIGAADMTKAVYDPGGRAEDIFAVTDGLAEDVSALDTAMAAADAALAGEVQIFACTLLADGWIKENTGAGGEEPGEEPGEETGGGDAAPAGGTDEQGAQEAGGGESDTTPAVYTQTASCPGLLADYTLEAPQVPTTGVQETDAALKEGLDALCEAGNSGEVLAGQIKWTCYGSPPTVDLPLRLRRAAVESGPGGGGSENGGQGGGSENGGEEA